MQVTAPVYETPSRLSQGLVVGLSVAVVLMAGWLASTIIFSDDMTTAAEGSTEAAASTPVAAASPADKLPGNAGIAPSGAVASSSVSGQTRPVQFDWPEEFDAKPAPPARTALPFAPTDLPAARDAGRATWPAAATVPDNARAFTATRQPPPQAGAATSTKATDAIIDLLSPPPPSGVAPSTRTVPARR
jgi:hypothetical protein